MLSLPLKDSFYIKISVYRTIFPEVFRSDRARIQKKPRCNSNKDLQFETFPQAMFKRQNIPTKTYSLKHFHKQCLKGKTFQQRPTV